MYRGTILFTITTDFTAATFYQGLHKSGLVTASLIPFWFGYTLVFLPKFGSTFIDDDTFWMRWYKAIYYPTWCRLDGLLAGVAIAAFTTFRPKMAAQVMQQGNRLLLLSVGLLTGACFLCDDQTGFTTSVFGFPLIATGYGLMVVNAISPSSFLYKIKSRITATMASLSYAIYLIHKIVIHVTQLQVEKFHLAKNSNVTFLLCIASCLLVAFILNTIIEKPFLRLRDRLIVKINAIA